VLSCLLSCFDDGVYAVVTQDGTTALHWAAKTTLLRCVNRLLELGADVNGADKVALLYTNVMFCNLTS